MAEGRGGTGAGECRAQGLTFRPYDLTAPYDWAALAALLRDIFRFEVTPLDDLGGPDPSTMAFGWFDRNGRLAANLSAFALPMMIDGRRVNAAGLQSGAVRPEFRGRGLFRDVTEKALIRDVTEKALTWCDAQGFEAVLLLTDKPALYESHGFARLPQSRFLASTTRRAEPDLRMRRLDLRDAADLALLRRMLAQREPVSDRFAVAGQGALFLLNAWDSGNVRLDLLSTPAAIIAWRQDENGMPELLDIVAETMPDLATILAALNIGPGEVAVDFVPDRLACEFRAVTDDDDLVLMMRSTTTPLPRQPIRLPALAQF